MSPLPQATMARGARTTRDPTEVRQAPGTRPGPARRARPELAPGAPPGPTRGVRGAPREPTRGAAVVAARTPRIRPTVRPLLTARALILRTSTPLPATAMAAARSSIAAIK